MQVLEQHLTNVDDERVQRARSDYANILKKPKQLKKDLVRLDAARRELGFSPQQVAADVDAWEQFQVAKVKAGSEAQHRAALKRLAPQLRAAKSRSNGIMSRRKREENIHAVGRLVTKHEGLLRQAELAKAQLVELRDQFPFLDW